ncbi:MAG: hypothetical protein ACI4CC_06985 [Lachnospiraceae bacterium]
MHTSLSKKLLAGLLSLVMVLSLVAPSTSAQAATKYSLTDKKSVKSGVTFKYELKGVSKGCYVKVTRNVSGEKVVYNKQALTKTTKINGTGKTMNLYVTYGEKEENYTGKFTVRVYGKKTNKLYKTLVEEVTVKVPEKEEPKEAELVGLKATASKVLTATLSATAEVTAEDIKVKKGDTTPNVASVTSNGTEVTITLGSKITEGTYSVTYKDVTLTVDTKDETLTTLETVGTNLVQTVAYDTSGPTYAQAVIGYRALNQYGERMAMPGTLSATSTFGTVAETTAASAKRDGLLTVSGISQMMSIVGTSGSIVLVDQKVGVNSTTTVTYSANATTKEINFLGMYNTTKGKMMDITAGDDAAEYQLVFDAKNQYGTDMTLAAFKADGITINPASILTNVTLDTTLSNVKEVTIDDEKHLAIDAKFASGSEATAGSIALNIVNSTMGIVGTATIQIGDGTLVKSISIAPKDTIYAEDANEMEFEVLDTEGNAITDYATLNTLIDFGTDPLSFDKQKDGSAKLYYTPAATGYSGTNNRLSKPYTITVKGNPATASKLVVKTFTFNVYTTREPVAITGLASDVNRAAAFTNDIKFALSKLVIEDQYGNAMNKSMKNYPEAGDIHFAITDTTNASAFANASDATLSSPDSYSRYTVATAGSAEGSATISLKYNEALTSDASNADYSFTIYSVDASKATNLKIAYVNYGYPIKISANDASAGLTVSNIVVTGTVGGKTCTIPTTQYVISGDTFKTITTNEGKMTKTAQIEVTVDTVDGSKPVSTVLTAEYQYSTEDEVLSYIEELSTGTVDITSATSTSATTITADDLIKGFYTEDQYGNDSGFDLTGIKYNVVVKSYTGATGSLSIKSNNTNSIVITGETNEEVVLYVTATYGDMTVTQLMKIKFNV